MGHSGASFGDGSGIQHEETDLTVATWAVVRMGKSDNGAAVVSALRGQVGGWFPTVPRAEGLWQTWIDRGHVSRYLFRDAKAGTYRDMVKFEVETLLSCDALADADAELARVNLSRTRSALYGCTCLCFMSTVSLSCLRCSLLRISSDELIILVAF